MGTDNYPKTITYSYYILFHYKKPMPLRQVYVPPAAVIFLKIGDTEKNNTVPGNNGKSFSEVTCYCCQETGNYAGNCPSSTSNTRTGSQPLQVGLIITQTTNDAQTNNIINPNWILLDTY